MKLEYCLCIILICFHAVVLVAQFPSIDWDYDLTAPSFGSAAAADMDNDGYYEIVFTTYTNDGQAHCLNAEDGSVAWIYDIGGCGDVAPLIYDVNQDDTLDVVIIGSCNPMAWAINGMTGRLIWEVFSGGGDSPPSVADIDEDGKPEILFGNFAGQLKILDGEDGGENRSIQVMDDFSALQTDPVIVDVNNDDDLDIIVASHWNTEGLFTWAFNYEDGSIHWTNFVEDTMSTFHAYHGGALADVDEDDKLEYVIGSNAGFVQAINVEDGSEEWMAEIPGSIMNAVTIADLDGNGDLEVICNNNDPVTFDDRIRILDGKTGEQEWSYPVTFSSFRGSAVSDINDNGMLDIVSGHFLSTVYAIEPYTGLIWELDLGDMLPQGLPYSDADQGPLIADFDKDGKGEIFMVAGYGTFVPDGQNVGRAFMIEAGNSACPEWLMFRQNTERTAFLSPDEANVSCDIINSEGETLFDRSLLLSPNPASHFISIGKADPGSNYRIYNSSGQLIRSDKIPDNGRMDISTLPPSLYILRLEDRNGIFLKF